MRQLTEDEAVALAKSGVWKEWSNEEIVGFQLYQERLCMDFSRFHEAVEAVLGRPVFTHEFAFDNLKKEFEGKIPKATLSQVIDLLPKDKTILIAT